MKRLNFTNWWLSSSGEKLPWLGGWSELGLGGPRYFEQVVARSVARGSDP